MNSFHYQAWPVFISLGLFLLMLFPFFFYVYEGKGVTPDGRLRHKNEQLEWLWFGLLLVLYSVFDFVEHDFYHYMPIYDEILHTGHNVHMESIYTWMVLHIPGGYYVWRLVVWGTASVLLIKTYRRFNLDATSVLVFTAVFYLMNFALTRGTLGIAMMFLGVSYILKPDENSSKRSYIIGVILIICSSFFHRSMYVGILALSFLPLKFTKKRVWLSIIIFPILVAIANYVIDSFFQSALVADIISSDTLARSERYMNQEHRISNINGIFRNFMTYGPVLASLVYVTYKVVYSRSIDLPKCIYSLFAYWYGMTYVAYIFYFQPTGYWMFSRFQAMANIPMVIVLAWIYARYKPTKWMKFLLLWMFISEFFFSYIYKFYSWEW